VLNDPDEPLPEREGALLPTLCLLPPPEPIEEGFEGLTLVLGAEEEGAEGVKTELPRFIVPAAPVPAERVTPDVCWSRVTDCLVELDDIISSLDTLPRPGLASLVPA